jgi:hypothetical protein
MKGLEPPRLTTPDPKSGAATNYATSAGKILRKGKGFFISTKYFLMEVENATNLFLTCAYNIVQKDGG